MSKEGEDLFSFNILEGLEGIEDLVGRQESSVEDTAEENIVEETEESSGEEQVVEENEDTDLEDTNSDDNDESQQSSPLTPYAKFLYEEGVLPNLNLESFDGTADGLKSAMHNEIVSGVDNYKKSLPSEVKFLIDHYEAGVPLDEIIGLQSNKVRYESIPDADIKTNEELQKALITDYLAETTKMDSAKIEKYVKRLADLGELEEEAISSKVELARIQEVKLKSKAEEASRLAAENEANRVKELENLKKTIETTAEIVPGQPISPLMRDKIFKSLTTPVAQDEYGNPLNKLGYYRSQNPVKTEMILNYLFEATKEFTDWSVFGKKAKTAAIKELEEAARNVDQRQSNGSPLKNTGAGASRGLMDAIKNINF